MTHGGDADFLMVVEIPEHSFHAAAAALFYSLWANGHAVAFAPQPLGDLFTS